MTVTVEPGLIEAGHAAVANGTADSLSGWVNEALADKAHRDRQLEELRAAVLEYEAEFGEITAEELAARERADREDAIVVRGQRSNRRQGSATAAKSG